MCAAEKHKTLHFFPPWFLTKEVMRKVEALLPYYYHTRFRFYFDRYGCVRCGKKDVEYCGCGLCLPCNGLINDRLKRTDQAMEAAIRNEQGTSVQGIFEKA